MVNDKCVSVNTLLTLTFSVVEERQEEIRKMTRVKFAYIMIKGFSLFLHLFFTC